MMMSLFFSNVKKVFTNRVAMLIWLLCTIVFLWVSKYFSNIPLMMWNLWYTRAYISISLHVLIWMLLGILVWSMVYKWRYFSKFDTTWWALWWAGSFLGILITWCPSCSITVASYLGLWSLISLLPFYWLEVKVLWLLLLWYSVYDTIKNLETCAMKKSRKKKNNTDV